MQNSFNFQNNKPITFYKTSQLTISKIPKNQKGFELFLITSLEKQKEIKLMNHPSLDLPTYAQIGRSSKLTKSGLYSLVIIILSALILLVADYFLSTTFQVDIQKYKLFEERSEKVLKHVETVETGSVSVAASNKNVSETETVHSVQPLVPSSEKIHLSRNKQTDQSEKKLTTHQIANRNRIAHQKLLREISNIRFWPKLPTVLNTTTIKNYYINVARSKARYKFEIQKGCRKTDCPMVKNVKEITQKLKDYFHIDSENKTRSIDFKKLLAQQRGYNVTQELGEKIKILDEKFYAEQEIIQNNRIKKMQNFCKSDFQWPPEFEITRQIQKIFYNTTYKYVMCLPPKTGTTNWQIALIENQLRNDNNIDNTTELDFSDLIPPKIFKKSEKLLKINPNIDHRKQFLKNLIMNEDKTWINGINARHPYARLYSAYNQKFEKRYYTTYYTVYKNHGDVMMLLDAQWGRDGKKFHSNLTYRSDEPPTSADDGRYENEPEHIASFESFLTLITLTYNISPLILDQHWQPSWIFCNPCKENYNVNFIAHTETADNDSKYFLGKTFQSRGLDAYGFQPAYGNSTTKYKDKYVEALGENWQETDLMKKIYKIYEIDFELYGYTIDDDF